MGSTGKEEDITGVAFAPAYVRKGWDGFPPPGATTGGC
jgi:hypothetical protein